MIININSLKGWKDAPMIKNKLTYYVFLPVVVLLVLCSAKAHALFNIFKFGGTIPVVGAIEIPTETIRLVQGYVSQATALKNQVTDEYVNNVKSKKDSYSGEFSGRINKKPIKGSKTLAKSKIADIEDPASIEDALTVLFFRYPTDDNNARNAYRKKAVAFYDDTVLEAYAASRQLDKRLEEEIKPLVDKLPDTLVVSGEDGGETPDSLNATYVNYYNAYQALDSIIAVINEVSAIKAQMRAALAIRNEITPLSCEQQKQQQSALSAELPVYASASAAASETLAFGQLSRASDPVNTVKELTTMSFGVQPEPDLTPDENTIKLQELEKMQPIYENMRKALDAHNTKLKLPQYLNIQKQYNHMVDLHNKAMDNLRLTEAAALEYIGRYYNDPVKVWSGIPMAAQINEHDLRKGISGWAVKAFEVAKAGSAAPADAEDFVEIEVDSTQNSADPATGEAIEKQLEATDNFFAEPSKEEEYAAESRESDLLPWKIGAQAAKSIGSNPGQWGSLKKSFPIWTDQKSFYDQYLKGKYQNIVDYINSLSVADINARITKALNDELAALRAEEERKINEAALTQINKLQTQRETQISQIDEALYASRQTIENNRTDELNRARDEKNRSLRQLESEKSSLEAALDEQTAELSNISAELKVAAEELEVRREAYEIASEELAVSRGAADGREAELSAALAQAESSVKTMEQQIASLESRRQSLNGSLAQNRQRLEDVKNQIADIENKYQETAAAINDTAAGKLAEIKSKRDEMAQVVEKDFDSKKSAVEEASDRQKAAVEVKNTLQVSTITSQAAGFIAAARSQAEKEVRAAEAQLKAMGDNLYRSENYAQIQAIHNNLINRLKAVKLQILGMEGAVLTTIEVYKDFLTVSDISPDTEYFVAAAPMKPRVLKAPKAPLTLSSAPLREIVHMDDTDWANIPRGKDGRVTREGFLAYGGEVPEIWKLLLKDKAFVETEINLKEVLDKGGEKVFLLRGGVYPCKLNGKVVDVYADKKVNFINSITETGDMPNCQGITLNGGSLYNPRAEATVSLPVGSNGEVEYSELGVILSADDKNNLYLKSETAKVFEKVRKIDEEYKDGTRTDETAKKMSDQTKMEEDIYQQSVLSRNQIGDFLKSVEREQIYRQSEEELRQSNENARQELIETLRGLGFEPSSSLDLSREADMKQVRSQLDTIKERYLKAAQSGVSGVKTADNELAQEQLEGIKNTLRALQKDSDELVTISESTDAGAALDEAIASAKVNNELENKYETRADEEMDKLGKLTIPYAPSY